MARSLSRQELQQWRLANQLDRSPLPPVALVAFLGAVQAQEKASALLAICARLPGVREADLQALLEQQRSVIRTWAIRGTLHLVARDDLHWLLALVAPRLLKNSRRRYRQLGLDEQALARATELIQQALAQNGALTRAELAAHLEANAISAEGQRMPHLLRRAALLGQLCLGPDRGGEETYVLLDAGVGRPANPGKGWEVLAGRYLAAYGPASIEDFSRWAGALTGEARAAFAAQKLVEIESAGNTLWLPAPQAERILSEAGAGACLTCR